MDRGPATIALAEDPNYQWNPPTGLMLDSTGICTLRSEYKMAQIEDGTSKTYMAGEKYLSPDNYSNGVDGADNLSAFQGYDIDTHRWTCEAALRDRPGYSNPFIFGSNHTSGWNVAYCDGSVHSLPFSLDLTIHRGLSNRHDGQVATLPE
jgi:prepilin-type processing-associated H-X9-DG protein